MFNNEFEVARENPFENDKLGRKEEVEKLTRLFEIVGNQMVLAIDSPWGTGKSTFLNMWNCNLRNEGYKTIFFNAWKNDFIEEPFIAFVSAIRDELIEQSKKKAFTERAQKVGMLLLKQSPKIVSKIVEKHTGIDMSEEVDVDGIESFIGKEIEGYMSNRDSLDKFKEELCKHTKEEFNKAGRPIVIFVDELDRCRPDYAIALLERIKHIFNVPNIIFILGIDKEALSNSIKVVYGNGTDINGYLSRFIDMEYTLNQASKKNYIQYLLEKFNFTPLINKLNSSNREQIRYEEFCQLVQEVIVNFNISLRDAEKILANMYISMMATRISSNLIYTYILLVIMKKVDIEIYRMIKEQKITIKEFVQRFDKDKRISNWLKDSSSKGINVMGQLMWLLDDTVEMKEIEELCNNVERDEIYRNEEMYAKMRMLKIAERNKNLRTNGFDERNATKVLKDLTMQIEMYEGLTKL